VSPGRILCHRQNQCTLHREPHFVYRRQHFDYGRSDKRAIVPAAAEKLPKRMVPPNNGGAGPLKRLDTSYHVLDDHHLTRAVAVRDIPDPDLFWKESGIVSAHRRVVEVAQPHFASGACKRPDVRGQSRSNFVGQKELWGLPSNRRCRTDRPSVLQGLG